MIHKGRLLPLVATMISFASFEVSLVDSFRMISPVASPNALSVLADRNSPSASPHPFATRPSARWVSGASSMVLNSAQEDNDGESLLGDAGGTLGIAASLVVLYSEFVLKTTGCGLPAGPFGVVGALEGVSYLGVVGICATSALDYFSQEETTASSPTLAGRLATILGATAALVGITVLAFQVTDYGYIPNAVPMEGGMCQ